MKVDFYTSIEGMDTTHPIIKASEVDMPWMGESRKRFVNTRKDFTKGKQSGAHMCSGIVNLMNTGWVITAWHDLVIRTQTGSDSFDWAVPSGAINDAVNTTSVGSFGPNQFGDFVTLPPQTLKTLVKLHTPWRFHMPKGWGLMMAPLQYVNEDRFTSTMGIIDPRINNELNPILYWHVLHGETLVKAGTPLCHLIPIKLDEQFDFDVRTSTEKEAVWNKFYRLMYDSTFITNRKMLSKAYDKFFRSGK
jgi:hypothetical protein